jgi:alkylated DNA repair protein (DNA oxidative demethylase)
MSSLNNGLMTVHLNVEHFETRRINFTFRYVPKEHIIDYKSLPAELQSDIAPYMRTLAANSDHFAKCFN